MIPKTQYPDVRVLLVEHQAPTASLYRFALDEMGFGQMICVANTEEALDQMYFNAPGLIILGNKLQPMPAEAFITQIRAAKTGAATDVAMVVMAAKAARSALEKAGAGGVTEIIPALPSMDSLCRHAVLALKKHRQQMDTRPAPRPRRQGVHQGKGDRL